MPFIALISWPISSWLAARQLHRQVAMRQALGRVGGQAQRLGHDAAHDEDQRCGKAKQGAMTPIANSLLRMLVTSCVTSSTKATPAMVQFQSLLVWYT